MFCSQNTGHSDKQCFSQKPTNIHTVEEETVQEELIGTGPSLVRASAVFNARAQFESVPTRTTFKDFRN